VTNFVLVRRDRTLRFVNTAVRLYYDIYLPHTSVSAIVIFMAYVVNPWLWVYREKRDESYVKIK
jgi:hypothetical protein